MRAVIGKFSGPYSPARTAKTLRFFVSNLLRDLSANSLNLYSKQKLTITAGSLMEIDQHDIREL